MGLFNNSKPAQEPAPVTIQGKALSCSHCGHTEFYPEQVTIHFTGRVTNTQAACFVCASCTQLHLFRGE